MQAVVHPAFQSPSPYSPMPFRLASLPGSPTFGLCRSGSRGCHPGNSRQRKRSQNRNRLRRARWCRGRDRSRQGHLHRWGGRSRHTCSRIRRYRTGQGSHARNRGESGTASCSPRSVSRHAICRKWESSHGDRQPHRTLHLWSHALASSGETASGNEAREARPWLINSDYLEQTRYPGRPLPYHERNRFPWNTHANLRGRQE